MDYIMDWHLIYRSAAELAALKPERAPADGCCHRRHDRSEYPLHRQKPLDE